MPVRGNGLRGTILVIVLGVFLCWVGFRPRVTGHQTDAYKRMKARADILAIVQVITSYALDHEGRYPADIEALIEVDSEGWSYLDRVSIPKDPWGTEYVYFPPRAGEREFRVLSCGKDGLPGGEGDDADVDSLPTIDGR